MIKIFKSFLVTVVAVLYLVVLPQFILAQAATLALSPSSGTANKGCSFSLNIILNTGVAQTDGTDAVLIYDPTRFTANSITNGTIYPDYPGSSIDPQAGKITISGLASISSAYSGQGTLATINFNVGSNAPAGVSQIKFDFDPNDKGKTTDSNVVQRDTVVDILNTVTDGSYTIGTGVCGSGITTASPSPSPGAIGGPGGGATPSATPKSIDGLVGGKPGLSETTFTVLILGSVFTVLGVLGLILY